MAEIREYKTHPVTPEEYEAFKVSWKEGDPIPDEIRDYVLGFLDKDFDAITSKIDKFLGIV